LQCCNEIWGAAGYPHTTGHSFRIGGTTELLLPGVTVDVVKAMGRWSSDDSSDIGVRLKTWHRCMHQILVLNCLPVIRVSRCSCLVWAAVLGLPEHAHRPCTLDSATSLPKKYTFCLRFNSTIV
jgi:hypothetical protein